MVSKKQSTSADVNNNTYTEQDIKLVEGLAHVRMRPGMYVGGTDQRALHHLVYEVVDNSIDEALAGRCDTIYVRLYADGSLSVDDNGAGIPVGINEQTGISTLESVLTKLGMGGKFDNKAYKVSGGLHGIGVSAVNALSEWLVVEVRRNGKLYRQEYERGVPLTPVEAIRELEPGESTGTKIHFYPDFTVMEPNEFHYITLLQRFREMSFLTRGVTLTIRDDHVEPVPSEMTFYFEGGVKSFVYYLNRNRDSLHDIVYGEQEVMFNENDPEKAFSVGVEFALQYTDSSNSSEHYFANTINTTDGGQHQSGFRMALTRTINNYARKAGILKEKDQNFSGNDVLEGVTAIISIKHPDPKFESQTKVKLVNPEVASVVSTAVGDIFTEYLETHAREARRIIEKCMTSMRARDAARKASELVRRGSNLLENSTLPGKLADCSDRNPENTELYIVEGDSAGGCFSGDTLIALADGRNLSFADLVVEQAIGKEHFCYTIRKDGKIGLGRITNARITKHNAQVIRVTLDNGEVITCTPDHRFMLRDGSYKQAADLTPNDSLMPLYRKYSDKTETGITIDGYEMAWCPRAEQWLFTHLLADWHNRWQGIYQESVGDHCHHIDFNKLNNNPTNIQRMSAEEHLALHRQHVSKTLHRPEVIEKCREIRQRDEFRAKMSERMQQPKTRAVLSAQAKEQWEDAEYKAYMIQKWQEFYATNADYRVENNTQLDRAQREYWSDSSNRQRQADHVRNYFAENPAAREMASQKAKAQWEDTELVEWRRGKTREQWTPDFRERRLAALHQTYYNKTLAALKQVELEHGYLNVDAYQAHRLQTGDKSLLRFDKFCERYFEGNASKAQEAVANFNHRIVSIDLLEEQMDVYDIEVPGTHNFALASGVFVHNSAKQGRDRHFQAILPLRGKILNTERARLNKILDNNEVRALISALGVGISEDFDISKLRYHRVIIMTDADVDGAHIRTLLLTFFFRYMTPLISEGYLYIAQPPIFLLSHGKNKRYYYARAGEHESQTLARALKDFDAPDKVHVQRYKGLGEMNPEQLWETTMDPTNRLLLQVTIEDASEADKTFDMLMGDEVPPRRRFIQTHARDVRNLDI